MLQRELIRLGNGIHSEMHSRVQLRHELPDPGDRRLLRWA